MDYNWNWTQDQAAAGFLGGMFAFLAVFAIIFILIAIVLYLLLAIGLYRMGTKRNVQNSWIAFIPGVQMYVVGAILGRLRVFGIEIPRPDIVLAVAPIAAGMVTWIPVIGWLIGIAIAIVNFAAYYYLFMMYKGKDSATLYLILGIIFAFLIPIFIFTLRNREPIMEPSALYPPQNQNPNSPPPNEPPH